MRRSTAEPRCHVAPTSVPRRSHAPAMPLEFGVLASSWHRDSGRRAGVNTPAVLLSLSRVQGFLFLENT